MTRRGHTVNNTWTLEDLYRGIAHQWRVLLSVIIIFIACAVGAGFLWPVQYQATAVLTVEPIAINESSAAGSVNMDTEKVVAKSRTVLTMASKDVPGSTLDELDKAVDVTVPKNSQVLEFTYTAADPALAAKSANAIATAYGNHRVATAQKVVSEATDNLNARIDALTSQMAILPQQSPTRDTLSLQLQSLQARQAALASATFYSGSLVSPAAAPEDSTKPSILILLAAGLFLGVLIGMFAALIRARITLERPSAREAEAPATSTRRAPAVVELGAPAKA